MSAVRASVSSARWYSGSNAAYPSAPPAARYAAWKRGLQCTPSASRVPPKSKRTTSVVLVMPVARAVLVHRQLHRHGVRHPHLVPAALPHVVAVILLIQRVRAVGGWPLDATVGHEQPAHDTPPAVPDRLAGRIVLVDGPAVAVGRSGGGAESRPAVQP